MRLIDLHTHSIITDGSYTPREVVRQAKLAGLAALAITDHDNLSAYDEAKVEADRLGIRLLTGIEMSVNYKEDRIHLLGLGFRMDDPGFRQAYKEFRAPKENCVSVIIENLRQRGIKISEEMLVPYIQGDVLDRYTLFRYFSSRKEQQDTQYIWDDYLNPAIEKINLNINVQEAITLIKQAGGITSLAHFHKSIGLKRFSRGKQEVCFKELRRMGLDGVEIQYPDYTEEDKGFIQKIQETYGFLPTGGTDFHGQNRPGIQIGFGKGDIAVPYSWYEQIVSSTGS